MSRKATITLTAYDADGNVIAKCSAEVSFYKFGWQKSKLESQAIVSDNPMKLRLSEQELETNKDEEQTSFTDCFIGYIFSILFNKSSFLA